jgi:methyltransferase-like protein/SAM-dependent methyltransferase
MAIAHSQEYGTLLCCAPLAVVRPILSAYDIIGQALAKPATEPTMSTESSSSYNRIPYEGFALYQTYPDHLAALARLFGLSAPNVETCRVLEVGCACGDNLIPMAVSLPRAQFVGIDLARRQVEMGRATIAALGLTNIELHEESITSFDINRTPFDFILAHGVYSWIESSVQDRLLQLCAESLTPDGLAYISYNTYPGWHMGTMVRDMMLYHARNAADTAQQVRSSRELLATLTQTLAKYDSPYARCLREEAETIQPRPDFYLFHEYLAESNQPIYFHEFIRRAAAHHLQYVGESPFKNMAVAQSAELFRGLDDSGPDWLAREQYYDFLKGQSFRQSVLCHANRECPRIPSAEAVTSLRFTPNVRPAAPREASGPVDNTSEEFQTFSGQPALTTGNPLVKALLTAFWDAWPRSLAFPELLANSESRLFRAGGSKEASNTVTPANLADVLIKCLARGLINIHVADPSFTAEIGEFPHASPLARRQARAGPRVANLRHQMIDLVDFDRLVIGFLDGSHDRAGLLAELKAAIASGVFTMRVHNGPISEPEEIERRLADALDQSLKRLAAGALLV